MAAVNERLNYDLESVYDPKQVEKRWYEFWEREDLFRPTEEPEAAPFSIVIPPPNVTGNLHIGHALNNTIQDILIRWRRMQGRASLWLPGTDHAGIATQAVVEKNLAREGLTRKGLGREAFLERVWAWKERYEANIIDQLKAMGCSCDWSRTRFTMDEGLSRAVEEVFVRYHEKGLIYRGSYIVNWCPRCETAVSDLEVNHEETEGKLWHILYSFAEGPLEDDRVGIVVATTRPETMLGDTAVAVHPNDERYRGLIGRKLVLPLLGREIPIVADEFVDPAFGSGAVKVTPAHDPNDFECGLRHDLEQVQVIGFDARMTEEAGPAYAGRDRYEARRAVVHDLEAEGRLVRVEDHGHAVGHCDRCGNVVEPLISRQWFVRMKPLAEPALQVVRDGRVDFVPERFTKVYINWMENIRDWCISRQLWWGHRIPAWECRDCGKTVVARVKDAPATCPACGGSRMERDPDVLDTWFSSALWPFSTMGWPEDTDDMRRFYPTDVLVTGYDIIFFWIARMIFSAREFTGEIPFRHVLVTGLVRDHLGRKMSKSLGNGVDPMEVIEKYGADTLRFTLVTGNTPGNDQRFQWEKVEGVRNFLNKIWNAARFSLTHLRDFRPDEDPCSDSLQPADRWILSRLDTVTEEATAMLERFELGEAARLLYEFFWSEFCDWYIELVKLRLHGHEGEESRQAARHTLWTVLETSMRLFHPFLPFLTEEIRQRLPCEGKSVMTAAWPERVRGRRDPKAEAFMELVMKAVRAVRNLRAEMNVPPGKRAEVQVTAEGRDREILLEGMPYIKMLAGLEDLRFDDSEGTGKAVAAVAGTALLRLPLAGLIDVDKETARLGKELEEARRELRRSQSKLANEGFRKQAPEEVVAKEERKAREFTVRVERLEARLKELAG